MKLKSLGLNYLPDCLLTAIKKRHYYRSIRSFSERDEPDLVVSRYLVRPGDTVVDVGANIGVYTSFLSELVGPRGRVLSIEPARPTFEFLSWNVRKLKLHNVELINRAMSKREGEAELEVPPYPGGGENYYQARISASTDHGGRRVFVVKTSTLDSLLESVNGQLTFIKMDVEGHELECLEASPRTMRRWKPACLIEVSGDPAEASSRARRVFTLLTAYGHRPWWFDSRRLRQWREGDQSVNYFFLTEDHTARLSREHPDLFAEFPAAARHDDLDVQRKRRRRASWPARSPAPDR